MRRFDRRAVGGARNQPGKKSARLSCYVTRVIVPATEHVVTISGPVDVSGSRVLVSGQVEVEPVQVAGQNRMFELFPGSQQNSYKSYSMKLPSTIIALFASLFIIGCATKEQQPTAAQLQNNPTKKWEKKENQY